MSLCLIHPITFDNTIDIYEFIGKNERYLFFVLFVFYRISILILSNNL